MSDEEEQRRTDKTQHSRTSQRRRKRSLKAQEGDLMTSKKNYNML